MKNETAREFRLGMFSREDKKMSFVDSESVQATNKDGEFLTSVLFEKSIRIKTDVKKENCGYQSKKFEFRLETEG